MVFEGVVAAIDAVLAVETWGATDVFDVYADFWRDGGTRVGARSTCG